MQQLKKHKHDLKTIRSDLEWLKDNNNRNQLMGDRGFHRECRAFSAMQASCTDLVSGMVLQRIQNWMIQIWRQRMG